MKLTYVRLLVGDFAASFRFYRDVMGLRPVWGGEGEGGYGEFEVGEGCGLALFDRAAMSVELGTGNLPLAAPGATQDRLALIFGVDNIDATYLELTESRGRLRNQPDQPPRLGHQDRPPARPRRQPDRDQ